VRGGGGCGGGGCGGCMFRDGKKVMKKTFVIVFCQGVGLLKVRAIK